MNRVFLVGNITGDIYFDVLKGRPFLRLILMTGKPWVIQGMRVVLWDDHAKVFYPYLRKGSELGVIGHITTRPYKDRMVTEIEAVHLVLLRNIDWDAGNLKSNQRAPSPSANDYFVVGTVGPGIRFEWRTKRSEDGNESETERYAYLQVALSYGDVLDGLLVNSYGTLAQVAYPYLQPGSLIAVDGHLETREKRSGQNMVEVSAEHMAFLQDIQWDKGGAAQKRLMMEEEILA